MHNRTPIPPMLAAALDYAQRGWRVVPLAARDKAPRLRDWPREATTDPDVIRQWWSEVPDGNVGVALGDESGIVSIDIDSEEGESLVAEMAHGNLPPTVEMCTARGRRLLYAIPDSLERSPKKKSWKNEDGKTEALAFTATGQQCVMPPSVHPDGPVYRWVAGASPAEIEVASMPDWLILEMTRPANSPMISNAGAVNAFAPGAEFNRQADWWRDVLEPAGFKPAGGRGNVRYYTRPGKASGISVSVGHYLAKDDTPALYVFSGSIPGLQEGKCYDLFGALVQLAYNGDFSKAASDLSAKGFGTRGHRPAESRNGRAVPGVIPTTTSTEPAPWEDPVDITAAIEPPPAFPIDVFPAGIQWYCQEIGQGMNAPVDYPATFILGIAAGAIGATLKLQLTETWSERASLYIAVVAPKSSRKSPVLTTCIKPLERAQAKALKEDDAKPIYATDTTVEGLIPQLKASPRGMMVVRDELSGWVAGFNQYKGGKGVGNDRQFWLEAWSGVSISMLRRNPEAPHIYVKKPCLSVVGGIQPAVLSDVLGRDDGLAERILLSYPTPLPAARAERVVFREAKEWQETVEALLKRDMDDGEFGPRPHTLRLTEEGWEVFAAWTEEVALMMNDPDRNEALDGMRSKLLGQAARLALVCYGMWHVDKVGGAVLPPLVAIDIERGVQLARYFNAHAERVYGSAGSNPEIKAAGKILTWLNERGQATISRRDIQRGLHRHFPTADQVRGPLKLLVQCGWIRYAPESTQSRVVYECHPRLSELSPSVTKLPPQNGDALTIKLQKV